MNLAELKRPRNHEVGAEPQGINPFIFQLDHMRHLQAMRKLLLDVDLALARRILSQLEYQLTQARNQLLKTEDLVKQQRELALLERQTKAALMTTITRWLHDEQSRMHDLVKERQLVQAQVQEVHKAKVNEDQLRLRRTKVESRCIKFDEIRKVMEQDDA